MESNKAAKIERKIKVRKKLLTDMKSKRSELCNTLLITLIVSFAILYIDANEVISKFNGNALEKVGIWIYFVYVSCAIIACLIFKQQNLKKKIEQKLKYPMITLMDKILIIILLGVLFAKLEGLIVIKYFEVKLGEFQFGYNLMIIDIVLLITYGMIRYKQCPEERLDINEQGKGIRNKEISIAEIYQGTANYVEGARLTDDPQIIDLLDRDNFVKDLVETIVNSSTDTAFTISIEGPWGCGKTSAIMQVKKRILESDYNEKIKFIDTFDPSIYADRETMVSMFFQTIFDQTGYLGDFRKIKELADKIMRLILGKTKASIIIGFGNLVSYQSLEQIKHGFEEYLSIIPEHYVIVIDNIDRSEAVNVKMLFKLLDESFKIKNLTYILIYDDERIERIFNDEYKTDFGFVKKLIQAPIKVPGINKCKFIEILKTVIEKTQGDLDEKQSDDLEVLGTFLYNQSCDLRDLVRILNSSLLLKTNALKTLDYIDYLYIESIKYYDHKMYDLIRIDKEFLTIETEYDPRIVNLTLAKKPDEKSYEKIKQFKEHLHEMKGRKYDDLLERLFAKYAVVSTVDNFDLFKAHLNDKVQKENISTMNYRMENEQIFDLYFDLSSNSLVEVQSDVKKFVNGNENGDSFSQQLIDFLKIKDNEGVEIAIYKVMTFISYIRCGMTDLDFNFNMFKTLLSQYEKIDEYSKNVTLSYWLGQLLTVCYVKSDIVEMEKYISSKNTEISMKLYELKLIMRNLENIINSEFMQQKKEKSAVLNKVICYVIVRIFEGEIDLFEDRVTSKNNVSALIYPPKLDGGYGKYYEDLKEYGNNVITSDNILNFLNAIKVPPLNCFVWNYEYVYSKLIMNLFIDLEDVKNLLYEVKEKSAGQRENIEEVDEAIELLSNMHQSKSYDENIASEIYKKTGIEMMHDEND